MVVSMTQLINKRDYEILADVYMREGQEAMIHHDKDTAIDCMDKALRLLKKGKSHEKYVKNLNTMGVVYAQLENEDKAFECYLEALANAEVLKSSYLKALCYINVGSCYQKMDRHIEAIKYFMDAEKLLSNPDVKKQEKYQMWTTVNYLNLRDAYGKIGDETDPPFFFESDSLVFV